MGTSPWPGEFGSDGGRAEFRFLSREMLSSFDAVEFKDIVADFVVGGGERAVTAAWEAMVEVLDGGQQARAVTPRRWEIVRRMRPWLPIRSGGRSTS